MPAAEMRERIVEAASQLLAEGGSDAMTTRAVSAIAGVQAPTIYRMFDDKRGLLDAATSHAFDAYLRSKASMPTTGDAVDDLRAGWDLHLGFGLANPAVYVAIYGSPRSGSESAAERQAGDILGGLVHRIAADGRLKIAEKPAARLIHATGRGTALTLIGLPEDQRDPQLATLARESVIAAVTTDAATRDPGEAHRAAAAITLRASIPEVKTLTGAESRLMVEWLDRIVAFR